MESQFQVDRGSCTTAHDGYEAIPSLESRRPGQPWKFVDEFQQLLGNESEPDPLFFVESWTFGMNAAVGNYQQRRKKQTDREAEDLDTFSLTEEGDVYGDFPATFTGRRETSWPPQAPAVHSEWAEDESTHDSEIFEVEFDDYQESAGPMTLHYACQLLEVSATSSRQEIRGAYRRKVSQWHPDRLVHATEEARQRATAQMAAINEAYRLLCSGLLAKPI
jgi:DnaJ-domain-containing protein 1